MKPYLAILLKKARTFIVHHPRWIPQVNGNSLLSKEVVKGLIMRVFALAWGLALLKIGEDLIPKKWCDVIDSSFEVAEKYLSDNYWLNFLITITLLGGLFIWLRRVWKDQYLSLNRLALAVWLLVLLIFFESFTRVHSAFCLDYIGLLCIVLLIQMVFEFIKLWNKRWQIGKIKQKGACYVTETPQAGLDKKVRYEYAKRIVGQLLNTSIREASFAVGVTGEWGAGKTSFLLDMNNLMKDKCYVIEFKPWNCRTADQIINEFFELFRKKIKDIYSPLQKPVLRYAQLLSDVEMPSYIKPIFGILPKMDQSIEDYKTKIEEGLRQLDKPIVVTIDDIDRLAADEMFEVLRLIRNTAAFPNLIFIVCYDKDYVVKQIQNKGITESDLYLEKIFPLELSLPKTEEASLMDTFRYSLIKMHYMHGEQESLVNKLTPDDELMMVRLLPTYRKIKRFARLFVTNSAFISKQIGEKQIDLYDLLLIEMVHYCMQDVYVILRDKPEELLDVNIADSTKQARYSLKNDYQGLLKDRSLTTFEKLLLSKCFEEHAGERTLYMAYVDSYLNYFCMSTPDVVVSKEEFASVLSNRSAIRHNVHDWFWKLPKKRSTSLYGRMMSARTKELSIEEWKSHVYLMLSWMCEDDYLDISKVFELFLLKDNFKTAAVNEFEVANKYLLEKLQVMIKGPKVNRLNVAKVLCGYYELIEERQSDYLLNCEEIKRYLILNFNNYMKEKTTKQDAINVVALNGNDINIFVKANHIARFGANTLMGSSMLSCENLIIDSVIDYFGSYEEKSSHLKEAKEIYFDNMNRYKTLSNVKDIDLEQEKKFVFGKEEYYHRYLKDCFVNR